MSIVPNRRRVLVSGGRLVASHGIDQSDLLIDGERIVRIAPTGDIAGRQADEQIDAKGLYVLPGVIDAHVHSRDPGLTDKEDFEHSTAAAAAGGVTTILEMPNAVPPVTDTDILAQRVADHERVAHVDFGMWALALNDENLDDLPALAEAGVVGAKLFWGFAFDRKERKLVYDAAKVDVDRVIAPASTGAVWRLFRRAAEAGLLVGMHCEDREILTAAAKEFGAASDYRELLRARPVEAEAVAAASAIELARGCDARIHILHVSSARTARVIGAAQAAGIRVTAETCPHYLTLTADDYFEVGPAMKVFPPVRTVDDRDALWDAVNDGTIASIASDHAPHTLEERSLPFGDQPAGAVGVETMLPVLLNEVNTGRMSLSRLARTLCEAPAELYGLSPRKGRLQVGADADVTLVDLDRQWQVSNERLHSKTKLSPWAGRRGRGTAVRTLLRGNTLMVDGELDLSTARGRFVRAHRRYEDSPPRRRRG